MYIIPITATKNSSRHDRYLIGMCCAAPALRRRCEGGVGKRQWGTRGYAALERRDHRRRPGPHSTACHSHRATCLCIAFHLPPRTPRTALIGTHAHYTTT